MYLKLILLPDTPRQVAMGMGVGVFTGMLPIIPLQTITAITLAWLFKGSKLAAAAGTWISNPITIPPVYGACYYLGRAVTPFAKNTHLPTSWSLNDLFSLGSEVALASLIGGLILASVFGPVFYWVTFKYIHRLQAWERRKLRVKFGLPTPDTY
jgi:hypothetical protein